MAHFEPANGESAANVALLLGIARLSHALGSGSTKLCEALFLAFGDQDERYLGAQELDRRLQPMVTELLLTAKQRPENLI